MEYLVHRGLNPLHKLDIFYLANHNQNDILAWFLLSILNVYI